MWKNIHIVQRICSSVIYGCVFIYVIIQEKNHLFYIFTFFLLIGSLYELNQMKSKLSGFSQTILIIYIITSLFLLNNIHFLENGDQLMIILLSQIWATDVGGYVIGKLFGKNKFWNISAQKTWEGVLGSYIFCMLAGCYFQSWITLHIRINWIILSLFIATSCIIGDLMISKIKRLNHKKNSGFFLPGHGGFLDRLDSLFFATFIYYLIICI